MPGCTDYKHEDLPTHHQPSNTVQRLKKQNKTKQQQHVTVSAKKWYIKGKNSNHGANPPSITIIKNSSLPPPPPTRTGATIYHWRVLFALCAKLSSVDLRDRRSSKVEVFDTELIALYVMEPVVHSIYSNRHPVTFRHQFDKVCSVKRQ